MKNEVIQTKLLQSYHVRTRNIDGQLDWDFAGVRRRKLFVNKKSYDRSMAGFEGTNAVQCTLYDGGGLTQLLHIPI